MPCAWSKSRWRRYGGLTQLDYRQPSNVQVTNSSERIALSHEFVEAYPCPHSATSH